jgi:hypothetical protein
VGEVAGVAVRALAERRELAAQDRLVLPGSRPRDGKLLGPISLISVWRNLWTKTSNSTFNRVIMTHIEWLHIKFRKIHNYCPFKLFPYFWIDI